MGTIVNLGEKKPDPSSPDKGRAAQGGTGKQEIDPKLLAIGGGALVLIVVVTAGILMLGRGDNQATPDSRPAAASTPATSPAAQPAASAASSGATVPADSAASNAAQPAGGSEAAPTAIDGKAIGAEVPSSHFLGGASAGRGSVSSVSGPAVPGGGGSPGLSGGTLVPGSRLPQKDGQIDHNDPQVSQLDASEIDESR